MRKIPRAAALGALVVLVAAAPALAQYSDPTTTTRPTTTTTRPPTTTTRPPTTTTTRPPTTAAPTTTPTTIRPADDFQELTEEEAETTTTTTAPPPAIVKPTPAQVNITAGEPVRVVAETDTAFDPEADPPTVTLSSSGDDATTVEAIVTATVNAEGELEIEVEVPEDTPESIITVTIVAFDSRGVERTIVYLFPVRPASSTTSTIVPSGTGSLARASNGIRWADLPVVPDAEVPAVVKAIQASIPDEATEQALLAELDATPDSVLVVDEVTLAVAVRPIDDLTGDDGARPLVAAVAVAAAGAGLLVLRRGAPSAKLAKGSR